MTCTQCDGHKIIRTVVPARAAGFLDGVCARCNGTGMEPDGIKSLPTLNIMAFQSKRQSMITRAKLK